MFNDGSLDILVRWGRKRKERGRKKEEQGREEGKREVDGKRETEREKKL